MFAVRRAAWHREGVLLDCAPGLDDALNVAGLDYEVVKVPAYWRRQAAGRGESWIRSRHAFVTVRADRGEELGIVGRHYQPLQNRDAFEVIRPLIDNGVLALETGGALRNGTDAWLLGRFDVERFGPVVREVFADEVAPYLLVANNHSGRRNARIAETPIRVVCANTLELAERDLRDGRRRSVAVRHTRGAEVRIVEAADALLRAIIERYQVLAERYRLLKRTVLSRRAFKVLVLDPVAPDPRDDPGWRPENQQAQAAVERTLRRRAELSRLWTEGAGHRGDQSAWEAYNGLVQALDHRSDLFPTRRNRLRSLLDGQLRRTKRRCMARLLAHAISRCR